MENKKIIKTYSPYCEETHKRILGVNTDKEGNEFIYQPERLSEKTPEGEAIV